MSKKSFTGGLNSLLGERQPEPESEPAKEPVAEPIQKPVAEPPKRKRGRPKTQNKVVRRSESAEEGTKENETRATFIVNIDLLEKLKAIAYWERTQIKEVINKALEEVVAKYERKNGDVQPKPKK
jgi:hypothetical protein